MTIQEIFENLKNIFQEKYDIEVTLYDNQIVFTRNGLFDRDTWDFMDAVCFNYLQGAYVVGLEIKTLEQYKEELQTILYKKQLQVERFQRQLEEAEKEVVKTMQKLEDADETYNKHVHLEWD